ncbi:MAG: sugar ABC transporter substrate-binding protein [Ostreibacterium sp.]
MKQSLSSIVLAVTMALGITIAQAADINIAVVTHGQASDAFWSIVKNGVEAAAKDTNVKVSYRSPETFNMVEMSSLIDSATNSEPDGLIVSIPDGDALGAAIKKAVAAGIPVISINSGSDVSAKLGALLHVGQDEFDAGKKAGEKLKAMGGKKAICVNQEVGNVSLDHRCEGFIKGFGVAKVIPVTMDPADIKAKIKASIEKEGDIDTILMLNASSAGEPALAALEEMGKTGDINLATFDLSANFLQAIVDGKAAFAIDQQPYLQGYLPVMFLAAYARYGLIPSGNVASGPNLITKEKAAQVIELSAKGIR